MEEPEGKYIHPFFSKKPALPKWRDIPWILFVLGVAWGLPYIMLGKIEMSDKKAGFLVVALSFAIVAGVKIILWATHKIFPLN